MHLGQLFSKLVQCAVDVHTVAPGACEHLPFARSALQTLHVEPQQNQDHAVSVA